ncbi:Hypothetical protein CINCED_3A002873 [Cinara cedri]|uniref:Uncharacterized protein n=1 Tax=Cinara cedri TaxID=506608 RepID=A0A5E4NPQ2_9HEMI|nr:Hypothetical protein CINCED_3A002873 [Cinara cedri]
MEEQRRLEPFEMWGYRRMLKISWIDKITNKEVLERMLEGKLLWKSIVKRRSKWIRQTIRQEGLLKLIIRGYGEGKNHRGSLDGVSGSMTPPAITAYSAGGIEVIDLNGDLIF